MIPRQIADSVQVRKMEMRSRQVSPIESVEVSSNTKDSWNKHRTQLQTPNYIVQKRHSTYSIEIDALIFKTSSP